MKDSPETLEAPAIINLARMQHLLAPLGFEVGFRPLFTLGYGAMEPQELGRDFLRQIDRLGPDGDEPWESRLETGSKAGRTVVEIAGGNALHSLSIAAPLPVKLHSQRRRVPFGQIVRFEAISRQVEWEQGFSPLSGRYELQLPSSSGLVIFPETGRPINVSAEQAGYSATGEVDIGREPAYRQAFGVIIEWLRTKRPDEFTPVPASAGR